MSNIIIGLTGGIGSGKTTVSNMFADLGIDIIDADVIAREVVKPNSVALLAIQRHFGDEYINDEQQLNRTKLRSYIFNHPDEKRWLNALLHPLIRAEIMEQLANAASGYCILVAPLLLENGLQALVNRVLIIDVDKASQIARTVARDPSSADEVKRIIASQMSREKRLTFANDVIDNQQASIEDIKCQVNALHQQYLQLIGKII